VNIDEKRRDQTQSTFSKSKKVQHAVFIEFKIKKPDFPARLDIPNLFVS